MSENQEEKGDLDDHYPSGESEYKKLGPQKNFMVKLRLLIAYPWERVRKGSILNIKLRGKVWLFSPLSIISTIVLESKLHNNVYRSEHIG